MSGGDLLFAAALLMAPPGLPENPPAPEHWANVRDAIHKIAVDWEILDPRETRYILSRPEDFTADINLLRRRNQELADAPKVGDGYRFPDRSAVNDLVRFNRAFRKHLDQRHELETDRCEELRAVMRETEHLYHIWDAVRDARCEFYYVTVRRQALKKLKEMVGDEAYAAGTLPPNVPTWRFNEMK